MKITLSKSQWEMMGKKAGWIKTARHQVPELSGTVQFFTTGKEQAYATGTIPLHLAITIPSIGTWECNMEDSHNQSSDLGELYSLIMEQFGTKIQSLMKQETPQKQTPAATPAAPATT